jgi:hypothetical protein
MAYGSEISRISLQGCQARRCGKYDFQQAGGAKLLSGARERKALAYRLLSR